MGPGGQIVRRPGGNPLILDTSIDLSRPAIRNPDGTISTEETITIESGGRHYLIPTIVGGKRVDEDRAVQLWQSGQNKAVGDFDTAAEAQRAAVARSRRIGEIRQ
jgi:hypothetical protein